MSVQFSQVLSVSRVPLLALLAALTGCASPGLVQPPSPPMALPAQWSQAVPGQATAGPATAQSMAAWWNHFNDPALTALVVQALQANTSVRSAHAALQQARALRDVASANRLPQVGATLLAQRKQVGQAAPGNTFQAGFDASWEPDVFGGLRAAETAREAELQAASANLGHVRVSLAAEVAVAYINSRGLQARLAIARTHLAAQLETQQITDWRVQAGLASSLDLEQARTASAQTQAQIPALETDLAQQLNSLAVLTGQTPGSLQTQLAAGTVPQPPTVLALSFPAETLRQRPDVHVAEQQVRAAWAQVAQANAARYPQLSLSGSLGLSAARLGDLTNAASMVRGLLASATASLFDGGAAQAQVKAQQAVWEQARANHEATVLGALQDVEDTLAALRGDRERLDRLQAAAESAGNADLLARHRYASGLIDFRTVLDTQKTWLTAQSDLETARATWSADHVRLYKALGGGWTPDTAQP